MIRLLLLMLLKMCESNKPKYDLHKKNDDFKLNDTHIILILAIAGIIFFMAIFFLIGSCTESGLYYNGHLY